MRRIAAAVGAAALATLSLAQAAQAAPSTLVIWAWERPEDLRFADASVEIAAQTGFVALAGDRVVARGRRFPLLVGAARVTTAVVHVQIDHREPLRWTPESRAHAVAAVLDYARAVPAARVQIDFEVRRSERNVLLDLLRDVRAALPAGTRLAITALASWCDTEDWLGAAPVDEVAPMLFRMGPAGAPLKARLAGGGDFGDPRCRKALAVSTDAPIERGPTGRRVYLFSPKSWTAMDFERVKKRVEAWGAGGG